MVNIIQCTGIGITLIRTQHFWEATAQKECSDRKVARANAKNFGLAPVCVCACVPAVGGRCDVTLVLLVKLID
jgi:hypothetical protein